MKYAIQNAKLFDGEKVIEKGSILFDENGIIEVSEKQLYGDINIDGMGKTVTPGLADCHVHMGARVESPVQRAAVIAWQAQDVWRYGITTLRSAADSDDCDIKVRDLINEGIIDGCRLICAGTPIGITGGSGPNVIECDTPDETRKAARLRIKATCDFIKLSGTGSMGGKNSIAGLEEMSEEQIKVVVEEANRTGKLVMIHSTNQSNKTAQWAAKAGVRSIEHVQMNEETAKTMAENGTYYCPTIICRYEIIHSTDPAREWQRKKADPEDLTRKKKALNLCQKYGVRIAAGTDYGVGDTLAKELAIYVEYGLSTVEALRAATKNAADMMNLGDETGSLEAGKHADIVVFDGDPILDISDVKKVAMTFQNGKLVYKKAEF